MNGADSRSTLRFLGTWGLVLPAALLWCTVAQAQGGFRDFTPYNSELELEFESLEPQEYEDFDTYGEMGGEPDITIPEYQETPYTEYSPLTEPQVDLDQGNYRIYTGYSPLTLSPQGEYPEWDPFTPLEFQPFDDFSQ
ncbi:MAG: hypothetical protein D6E12_17485 [Desulfovibrio sp.]|nr:MAG: hypothetical protein D6E12_17485 [Desulfovibrio sp.]